MIFPVTLLEELAKAAVDAGRYRSADELAQALKAQLESADTLQILRDAWLRRELELADAEGGEHPAEEVFDEVRRKLREMKITA
jgi:Arc/MetJ-type ribon-helix-helix transcriptional regulator